jgi:hypothetical protein
MGTWRTEVGDCEMEMRVGNYDMMTNNAMNGLID